MKKAHDRPRLTEAEHAVKLSTKDVLRTVQHYVKHIDAAERRRDSEMVKKLTAEFVVRVCFAEHMLRHDVQELGAARRAHTWATKRRRSNPGGAT